MGGWGRVPWAGVGLVGGPGFWGACVGCLGTTVYSPDTVCVQMLLELFFSNGLQETAAPLHTYHSFMASFFPLLAVLPQPPWNQQLPQIPRKEPCWAGTCFEGVTLRFGSGCNRKWTHFVLSAWRAVCILGGCNCLQWWMGIILKSRGCTEASPCSCQFRAVTMVSIKGTCWKSEV